MLRPTDFIGTQGCILCSLSIIRLLEEAVQDILFGSPDPMGHITEFN